MESDLSRILQGINWDGILETDRGASPPAAPRPPPPVHPTDGSSPLHEGAASLPADGATGVSAHPPPPLLPLQQPQHQQRPPVQMGPAGGAYYVNAAPYQAISMQPGQVQTQPIVFAQPGGQMMYMSMPYIQHAVYQPNSSPQHVYSASQAPYYPSHIVQLPSENPIMHSMPRPLQQPQPQPQYRAFPQFQTRGPAANTLQQQHVEVSETDMGCGCLFPGTQLPQGVSFFPFGVHPTTQYAVPWTRVPLPSPPAYESAFLQFNRQVVHGRVEDEERECQSISNRFLPDQDSGDLSSILEDVSRFQLRSKQAENLTSPLKGRDAESVGNAPRTITAADKEKDTAV